MQEIRPAAVAGMFYPADASQLATDVKRLLAQAEAQTGAQVDNVPKAIIVPHAGYVYSGAAAASAYARLRPLRDRIRRVVLLGPAHRAYVRGLALPGSHVFETPLGRVPVDAEAVARLARLPQICESPVAHSQEHSLEVQLPFLQTVLADFTLAPLAVGDASTAETAQALEAVWGGDETLIVISSDLSHFHPYGTAQMIDRATTGRILDLSADIDHEQACGATPINGLLACARRHQLAPQLLALCNSGDTAGDHSRVVGYAAFAFTEVSSHVH